MRVGDYLLYSDMVWFVCKEHIDSTIQIKCLTPNITFIDNMQVKPEDCTPITKEVADIMRAV
jgi:hypothetical protein